MFARIRQTILDSFAQRFRPIVSLDKAKKREKRKTEEILTLPPPKRIHKYTEALLKIKKKRIRIVCVTERNKILVNAYTNERTLYALNNKYTKWIGRLHLMPEMWCCHLIFFFTFLTRYPVCRTCHEWKIHRCGGCVCCVLNTPKSIAIRSHYTLLLLSGCCRCC